MFTKNVKDPVFRLKPEATGIARRRGRPPGESAKGAATRQRLYEIAVALIAARGYEGATLREVADEAGVSVALLYRYFPSKRAVVLALYDELSAAYTREAAVMPPGRWRERFLFALRKSLDVLAPHRPTLQALIPVLVSAGEDGLFAAGTAFSRRRVQAVFESAVADSTDAPRQLAGALGRLLYLIHVLVLLWWLQDKSPKQRATAGLVALFGRMLPMAAGALRLPPVRRGVISADALVTDALFQNAPAS